ncbi:MAG: hypothetical protein PHT60_14920 [Acidiphilium sp.]|nr:hypothetical protein [Acidiphilium sp.]MDD4937054.1 hypothetical protein [Acidiphilium sp.]
MSTSYGVSALPGARRNLTPNYSLCSNHDINTVQHAGSGLSSGIPPALRQGLIKTMILRGVSRDLLAAIFACESEAILDVAVDLNLPTPPSKKIRLAPDDAPNHRLFSARALRALLHLWLSPLPIEDVATQLGRTPESVKRKARSVGLMLRQRADWQGLADRLGDLGTWAPPVAASSPAISGEVLAGPPADVAPAVPLKRRVFNPWTLERTKFLCEAWLAGRYAHEIGASLGVSAAAVASRAVRASLPKRTVQADGTLRVTVTGYICLDKSRGEYFWSDRSRYAEQSAYRVAQARKKNHGSIAA